jgi:AbrB family looped-hinge helix DNA binding protein
MRVTTKGQVTIPRDVRDRAGIKPGMEVQFGGEGELVTLRRAPPQARPGKSRGERLVEAIRGTATRNRGLSTDEIMKLLRGDD